MSANYSRPSAPSIRSVSSSHSERLPPRQEAVPAKIRHSPEPPNGMARSRLERIGTVSVSSEDFEGPRTAHDARPQDTRLDRVRASTWTQTSGATVSSSLYPPSSSEATGTESPPDPTTPTESSVAEAVHNDENDENEEDDVYNRYHQLDPDDVSYRLRLLVRNNYYLPPAHSKPLHASLRQGTTHAASPSKSSSPTIMGLFRLGSSKPRGISTALHPLFPKLSIADHKGQGDQSIPPNIHKDTMVDPTGVVDLPAYAFEPQASIGNVLGRQSMGADALVEFLPSSRLRCDVQDEAWRRALLTEAVDHSMSSIPDVVGNTPSDALRSVPPSPVRATSHADIGRPIIRPGDPTLSTFSAGPEDSLSMSPDTSPAALRGPRGIERGGLPGRTKMDDIQMHPLPPPPRKKPKTPPTRNAAADSVQFTAAMPRQTIRKTLSTPLLSEAYGPLSPPPLPSPSSDALDPRMSTLGVVLPSRDTDESLSSGSHYSENEDPGSPSIPRASFASVDDSMVFSNRPSLTASHLSHISSAFGGPPSPSLFPRASIAPSRTDSVSNRSSLAQRRAQSPRALTLSPGSNLLRPSDTVQEQDEKTPTIAVAAYGLDSEHGAVPLAVNFLSGAISNSPGTKTPRIAAHPITGSQDHESATSNVEANSAPSDAVSTWARDQGQQDLDGKRALDGLLKLHIEAEKDHMRRIASNLRK
ncbi:hypothetical protein BS47DRAFT_1380777 [Hydnum rufescens UP504]|uniref:Uncharacterized protein n=1 Tax=Hydnum rufescens UP504 TaxID=1448309 RepID=A0A9P6DZH9_9AGAM|nr:hypothetical protein BS47DRAFT_1380777 [Hydnum rufescens UP504]